MAFEDRSTGRGTFGCEFGAPYCNQWGLYGVRVDFCSDAALFPNYFGQTCLCIRCIIDHNTIEHVAINDVLPLKAARRYAIANVKCFEARDISDLISMVAFIFSMRRHLIRLA